jgi:nicotinate-nucleotide adenylyltransferase
MRGSVNQRSLQLCFGGSFDPIHNAHLRVLWEVSQRLQPEVVRLLPSHIPPHKNLPESTPEQRLHMLSLALHDQPDWTIDKRELARSTRSYTFDTLVELRAELGAEVALVWLLGMDSFASLNTWHRWRELADYTHFLVVGRPGSALPEEGPVADWGQNRLADIKALRSKACGSVVHLNATQQDIASSLLRADVRAGLAPRYLVPEAVCHYIVNQQLYR